MDGSDIPFRSAGLPVAPLVAMRVRMNLRLPAVATVIVAAAGFAAYRAFHPAPAPPIASIATGSSLGGTAADAPPVASSPPRPRRTDARVTVYVAGAVVRAGVYALPASSRGVDALHAAGGARGDADLVAVNLAQVLEDGEEIVVPVVGADPPAASAPAHRSRRARSGADTGTVHRAHRKRARKHRTRRATSSDGSPNDASGASSTPDESGDPVGTTTSADPPTETVDLNTADENELETLPGIGASLASRIVTFREINGPFASPDDLLDVGGMTQGRLDAIEPYVTTR
jgi:competence protein ComEA